MIFSKEEYLSRLAKVKNSMDQKNMDVIILTDPSNMNYLTGYDGWSFYVPQGIIVALELDEPIWFGRRQDSKGAKVTTYLQIKISFIIQKILFNHHQHILMILSRLLFMRIIGQIKILVLKWMHIITLLKIIID
jgi:Xaa-Pro aminopeptidase